MTINIDIKTVLIVLVLGHFFSGILIIAYMVQYKQDKSVNTFLLSKLFELIAWVLIGLRDIIPDFISISVGNSILFIGTALQITAFLILKDIYNILIKRIYLISIVTSILIFNFVSIYYDIEGARVLVASLIVILLWCFPIYKLLTDKKSSILQRVIAIFYSIAMFSFILRVYVVFELSETMKLMSSNIFNVFSFLSIYLVMMIGSIGFILMSKEKSDLELIKAATFDELTSIFNRRTFIMHAKKSISMFSRRKEPISFILIDLDNFKKINDNYGHYIGDAVLIDFATKIKIQLRGYDIFGRYGGEEFAVFLPGADEKKSMDVAERLRRTIEDSIVSENHNIKYTISIGVVSTVPNDETTIDTLYKLSDSALYMAKMKGKNCIVSYQNANSNVTNQHFIQY